MEMKQKIVDSIEDSRTFFESSEMCFITLNGGYEKIVQSKLALNLNNKRIAGEEYYLLERYNRTDIVCEKPNLVKHKQNVTSCIELGHNGIFSPRENGVINHAVDDINKRLETIDAIYTISILTAILEEGKNPNQIIQYYSLFKPYINNPSKIKKQMKMIMEDKDYFLKLDPTFRPLEFITDKWNGFKSQIYMFVAGPFITSVKKWW